MTTPLRCLVFVAILPYLLGFLGGYFRMRQFGGIDNKHPRLQQAKMEGIGARAVAAHQNAWEALGFFTAAVAVLSIANPTAAQGPAAANLSLGFLATRIAHPILYLANLDVLRSAVFLVGIACVLGLFYIA
ncbi:MAG TPA: MAPEG family protein [Myxococcota bacterium]|nr:MAPEG family protein [Myxococcota bacterium]